MQRSEKQIVQSPRCVGPERGGRRAWSRVAVAKGGVRNTAGRAVVPGICAASRGEDRVLSCARGSTDVLPRNTAGPGNCAQAILRAEDVENWAS